MPKPIQTKLPVSDCDLARLRESGISDRTIMDNGLRTERDALVFPYRNLAGELNGFARRRPHVPLVRDGKTMKYIQPKGSPLRAYYPKASLLGLRDDTSPIYVTEGEKKALRLSELGIAAIGIGGVDGWGKGGQLIDDLADINWTGRDVYIVFDYDEKPETRRNVQSAARRLTKALRDAGANEVFNIDLTPTEDGNKQGVDDFLMTHEVSEFWELVDFANPVESIGDQGISSITLIPLTPPRLSDAAYHGFVGDFIRTVSPYTEATDAGILAHLLPAIGTLIGPGPHIWGGDEQPARVNTALVGPTSSGRKGTSFVPVNHLMRMIDAIFWNAQCVRGLSSGEGLIQKVSDQRTKDENGAWNVVSVEKRLYVVEPEFSKILMQTRREGNILSQVLRETYDSGNLAVLTRNPLTANNAHMSITGHITPEELRKRLGEIEMANGFANRFLWFLVDSVKELPDGEPIPEAVVKKFVTRLKRIIQTAANQKRLTRDEAATTLWKNAYSNLRMSKPGLQGAMLARGESIVLRLSLIYALLDETNIIRREHVAAALAVWKYSEESVRAIFKEKSGSSLADKLYQLLGNGPMMTKQFHDHMNTPASEIREALGQLLASGRITKATIRQKGAGRPAEQWSRLTPKNV